jgi:hypothetical protein
MENNGEFHELNEFFRFRIAGELLELVGLRPQNYKKIGKKKYNKNKQGRQTVFVCRPCEVDLKVPISWFSP